MSSAHYAYLVRIINDLRRDDEKVFFHDEIWPNAGDERWSVWKTGERYGGFGKTMVKVNTLNFGHCIFWET